MTAYQAAAELKMPDVDPTEYKIGIDEKLYTFPNNPMNRGIFAIKEFLGQDQADLMPAVCTRLMALGVIREIRDDERFAQFLNGDAPDGGLLVDDALLDSFATATFVPRTLDFDLQSVLAIALQNARAENPAAAQPPCSRAKPATRVSACADESRRHRHGEAPAVKRISQRFDANSHRSQLFCRYPLVRRARAASGSCSTRWSCAEPTQPWSVSHFEIICWPRGGECE